MLYSSPHAELLSQGTGLGRGLAGVGVGGWPWWSSAFFRHSSSLHRSKYEPRAPVPQRIPHGVPERSYLLFHLLFVCTVIIVSLQGYLTQQRKSVLWPCRVGSESRNTRWSSNSSHGLPTNPQKQAWRAHALNLKTVINILKNR